MNYEINRLLAEGRMKEMRDYAFQNNLYGKKLHKKNKRAKHAEKQRAVQILPQKKVG
ncbi:hypothetical protein [Ornithinibacillus sp. 179-J 7C1 HS]|uniref:hypothetical protein n=1 Tax=Ornithinibacillus sp. 179-J 7C1 HS TaxID=3142384 RepID=UPI0039A2D967